MKKLLIFDAFGTLINCGNGSIKSCEKILALQDKDIDPVSFYATWKKIHRRNINNCINTNTFLCEWDIYVLDLKELYELYKIDRPYKEDVKLMFLTQFNRTLFDDVMTTINKLKEKYRVVIGSTADTFPLLVNLKYNDLSVHKVYTSEMIKTYKPDCKFYEYILRLENVAASEAVFIGDSTLDDVIGPSALGITTVLIHRNNNYKDEKAKPDYLIHNLNELLDIEF